jgi:hypothetical protein
LICRKLSLRFRVLKTHQRFDSCDKHNRIRWLDQVRIGSAFQRVQLALIGQESSRQLKYRNMFCSRIGLKPATHFVAENIGKLYVENNDRWQVPGKLQRFLARCRLNDRISGTSESVCGRVTIRGSIIGDEYGYLL